MIKRDNLVLNENNFDTDNMGSIIYRKITNIEEEITVFWNTRTGWIFDLNASVAVLLLVDEIFLNDKDMNVSEPFIVRCNDIIAPCSSEFVVATYKDIEDIIKYYLKDNKRGVAVWCMDKLDKKGHPALMKEIQDTGIWSL